MCDIMRSDSKQPKLQLLARDGQHVASVRELRTRWFVSAGNSYEMKGSTNTRGSLRLSWPHAKTSERVTCGLGVEQHTEGLDRFAFGARLWCDEVVLLVLHWDET